MNTETKSSTASTTKKSKTPVRDIMEIMLDKIDVAENVTNQEREEMLRRISELHKQILNERWVRVELMTGFQKFEKRAKRRAVRKPLTIQKARNLANDLYQLAKIFNV